MFSACCRGCLYCHSGNCRMRSQGWRAGHGMNKTQLSPLAKLHYPRGCAVRELNVVFSWGRMGWRLFMVSVWLILEGWAEIPQARKRKEIPERWSEQSKAQWKESSWETGANPKRLRQRRVSGQIPQPQWVSGSTLYPNMTFGLSPQPLPLRCVGTAE